MIDVTVGYRQGDRDAKKGNIRNGRCISPLVGNYRIERIDKCDRDPGRFANRDTGPGTDRFPIAHGGNTRSGPVSPGTITDTVASVDSPAGSLKVTKSFGP